MSNEFNNKDYADYFSKLENSLNKEETDNSYQKTVKTEPVKNHKLNTPLIISLLSVFVAIGVIISGVSIAISNKNDEKPKVNNSVSDVTAKEEEKEKEKIVYPFETNATSDVKAGIDAHHIIVVNADDHSIVAMKDAFAKAYPASTTKIMTLLTAVDYIEDYTDTFTMTFEITDPLYQEEATVAGFAAGEVINLEDMLYGIILPSGGDASIGVATKISGSEKGFVKLMNKKAKELGLKCTNFTNCTGLFDTNHYTSAADMAVILSEAMKNPICRKILTTYKYTAKPTAEHPEGLEMTSTLFSYMYGTEPVGADILGGKTGFVNESGYCIASFGQSDSGEEFIAITFESPSKWPAFFGQIDLFSAYVGKSDVMYKSNN